MPLAPTSAPLLMRAGPGALPPGIAQPAMKSAASGTAKRLVLDMQTPVGTFGGPSAHRRRAATPRYSAATGRRRTPLVDRDRRGRLEDLERDHRAHVVDARNLHQPVRQQLGQALQ